MSTSPSLATSSLADYTSASLIVPQLGEGDTPGVIQELSRLLQQANRIPDLLPFYHAVLNREFLVSTAMDYGMAFPHARLGILKDLCFALGRTTRPISWGPKGTVPINLVFLIAVPATDAAGYINLISGFARLGKESQMLARICAAEDGEEMMAVLRQIPVRPGKGAAA